MLSAPTATGASRLSDTLLTVGAAAAYLGVSQKTVRRRVSERRIAFVQESRGAAVRIPREALDAYIEANLHPAKMPSPAPATEGVKRREHRAVPPAHPRGGTKTASGTRAASRRRRVRRLYESDAACGAA
jgi:excisionase family DNA binding protein